MRPFLLLLALSAGVGLLSQALPACTSSDCDASLLASQPAFFIPFKGKVDDAGCTVSAYTADAAGNALWMECAPYRGDCLCQGGGSPGVYEVVVYDVQSRVEIDRAEVTVHAAPAPECRTSEVTAPFDEALEHGYFGAGGFGGFGGMGGVGGAEP